MNTTALLEALSLIFANRDKLIAAGETVWSAAQSIWNVFAAVHTAKISGAAEPVFDQAKLDADIATVKGALAA